MWKESGFCGQCLTTSCILSIEMYTGFWEFLIVYFLTIFHDLLLISVFLFFSFIRKNIEDLGKTLHFSWKPMSVQF